MEKDFKQQLSSLPTQPGVYKFLDKEQDIIYVGKAKNLKNRVSSYFTDAKQHSRKTLRLVSQIAALEFTIVNTELDALLLENSLIKQYQPKYNILLKDDKSYPYICVSKEHFPKVFSSRRLDRRQGTFYGPFSNVKAMNALLDLIQRLYSIRTCSLAMSPENIAAGKFKVCLEYHLKNCKGGCEGLQSEEDYLQEIQQVHQILKGNIAEVAQHFKEEMQRHAEALAFEKAQEYKEKLDYLQIFQEKSLVVNPKITDLAVITISSEEESAFLNFLDIKNGAVIHADTLEIAKRLDESDTELLLHALLRLQEKYSSTTKEILTNIEMPEEEIAHFSFSTPKIGDKRKLVEMSLKNVLFAKKEKLNRQEAQADRGQRVLEKLKTDLRMQDLPLHIECFDNSNIQGSYPVAAMVCFKNAKPAKRDYRHFHIKTVEGPNDFASMYEIVSRRYKRLQEEAQPLPQLVVVDGGKGQLSAAVQALKDLGLYGKMAIIGIAKRLEEIYFPYDEFPLHLSKKSESLRLLQHLRDEAHRFAITFHRDTRSKGSIQTVLAEIEGIGEKTAQKLLQHFKAVKNIKDASLEELAEVLGKAKAEKVLRFFQKDKEA